MRLGTIFFILNIIFYLINVTMTISRAIRYPKVFKQSFYDRSEAVWFPTSVIGMATLIIGTMLFGIPRCGVSYNSLDCWWGGADKIGMASSSCRSLVLRLHVSSCHGSSPCSIGSVLLLPPHQLTR
jgi:tellurite resistance protein TehA-like permease